MVAVLDCGHDARGLLMATFRCALMPIRLSRDRELVLLPSGMVACLTLLRRAHPYLRHEGLGWLPAGTLPRCQGCTSVCGSMSPTDLIQYRDCRTSDTDKIQAGQGFMRVGAAGCRMCFQARLCPVIRRCNGRKAIDQATRQSPGAPHGDALVRLMCPVVADGPARHGVRLMCPTVSRCAPHVAQGAAMVATR